MHTIQRRFTTIDDYEEGTNIDIINIFNILIDIETNGFTNKNQLKPDSLQKIKWNLPEGYLQSRVVCTNYKTIKNIIQQRYNHKLYQWQTLINTFYRQLEHQELLPDHRKYVKNVLTNITS
jgi:hypothetical protein